MPSPPQQVSDGGAGKQARIVAPSVVGQPFTRSVCLGYAATFGFLGVVMLPLLPISIEAGVECTYPVPEVYSSGLLLSAGTYHCPSHGPTYYSPWTYLLFT